MRKMFIEGIVFNKSSKEYKGKKYYAISVDTGYSLPTLISVDEKTYNEAEKGKEVSLMCDFYIDFEKKRLSIYVK